MKTKKQKSVLITVALPERDWMDLVNFVTGDLHNMASGDPVAEQMERVLEEIRKAVAYQT